MMSASTQPVALGPVHKYRDIFENGEFFLRILKNLRPHGPYSNRICTYSRVRKNDSNSLDFTYQARAGYECMRPVISIGPRKSKIVWILLVEFHPLYYCNLGR